MEKNTVKTVKDLKEYLNMLPDDALIYEQITTKGKHLEAVEPNIKVEPLYEADEDEDLPIYYNTIHCYKFPDFVQVPLSTESAFEFLKRYYNNND